MKLAVLAAAALTAAALASGPAAQAAASAPGIPGPQTCTRAWKNIRDLTDGYQATVRHDSCGQGMRAYVSCEDPDPVNVYTEYGNIVYADGKTSTASCGGGLSLKIGEGFQHQVNGRRGKWIDGT